MRIKKRMALVTLAAILAGCGASLNETKVRTSSEADLAETLETIKQKHGAEAARAVIQNIGFVMGNAFSDPQLDASFSEGDIEAMAEKLDELRHKALADLDGMSVGELEKLAAPLRHEYRMDRKEKAQARLPEFEAEKARVKRVEELQESIALDNARIVRSNDEFGFLEPSFAVDIKNGTDLTIKALDLEVHAWSTIDPKVNGTQQVRLMFPDEPVAPGDQRSVTQALSPVSDLTSAVAQGAGQGVRMKFLVAYSEEEGRLEMNGVWTEEMEANLQQLKEYAAYSNEQYTE